MRLRLHLFFLLGPVLCASLTDIERRPELSSSAPQGGGSEQRPPPHSPPPPVVILTQTCSQSSWVVWAVQRLVTVAGLDFARGEAEVLHVNKPTNRPHYASFRARGLGYAGYLRSLRAAHADAGKGNVVWVIKAFPSHLEKRPDLVALLRDEWGAQPINLHRENGLDRLICEVGDDSPPPPTPGYARLGTHAWDMT
jgi:hypothetical protein